MPAGTSSGGGAPSRAAERLARTRDTDRKYHAALADLNALMTTSATTATTEAVGGARLLATMVDVPLVVPSTSSSASAAAEEEGASDRQRSVSRRHAAGAAGMSLRRTGTAVSLRETGPLQEVKPRSYSAVVVPDSPEGVGPRDPQRAGGETPPRVGRQVPSETSATSQERPPECSSPETTTSPWGRDARMIESSSRPVSSCMSDAPEEHDALAAAIADRNRQREERRRAREEQRNATKGDACEEPPEGHDSTNVTIESAAAPDSTPPQEDEDQDGSAVAVGMSSPVPTPEKPKADPLDVYAMEVDLVRKESAQRRMEQVEADRLARQAREAAEERRRHVANVSRDLSWEESAVRKTLELDEREAHSELLRVFEDSFTPAMDRLCGVEREDRVFHAKEELDDRHALARQSVFEQWVEGAASLRVEELDVFDEIRETFIDIAVSIDVTAEEALARAPMEAQGANERKELFATFATDVAEVISRELWLLVNAEAEQRGCLESEENDDFYLSRTGAPSSRVAVGEHAAAVSEARQRWAEHFRERRSELLDMELAGRTLLNRAAFDGLDQMMSDARVERAYKEAVDLRQRKEAVDRAIREAQLFSLKQSGGGETTTDGGQLAYRQVAPPKAAGTAPLKKTPSNRGRTSTAKNETVATKKAGVRSGSKPRA